MPAISELPGVLIDDDDRERISAHRWSIGSGGYVSTTLYLGKKYKTWLLSRFILKPEPGIEVDHINGNKLDNRKSNLRAVSHKTNSENRQHINRNATSGYPDVTWSKRHKKFYARCQVAGAKRSFGYHDDPYAAYLIVEAWRREAIPGYIPRNISKKESI